MKNYQSPNFKSVELTDSFFSLRLKKWQESTIPSCIQRTIETGRIDAFKLDWQAGMPNKPHIFWDSDVAKVLEGISYALALTKDAELEALYDNWIDLIVSSQQQDGYLNSYFSRIEPENRWKDLEFNHELYCAGHLIEAAVASYENLGKRKLLEAMIRYVDYIDSVFGLEAGKRRGWPGHEEIELALMKLYKVTKNEKHKKLAEYFIYDRGTKPNVFELQEKGSKLKADYLQAHLPVCEQTEAIGHSVRAVYLYSGMADVAQVNHDKLIFEACERLFENIRQKKMYISGGIGSSFNGETFTCDYDLENGSMMYAESCAAMGLVFFAQRMFNQTGDYKYIDVLERSLFNGVLSGISLDGDKYFYTNYLEVDDNLQLYNAGSKTRQAWFDCSCCPTSFSRFIPQISTFLYSVASDEITLNIPSANKSTLKLKNQDVSLEVSGNYPYDGKIKIVIKSSGNFTLNIRIPNWCNLWTLNLNGEKIENSKISRDWQVGDILDLNLDMPIKLIHSNPKITSNLGKVAITRGPLLYALEELDQEFPVRELIIDSSMPLELVECPTLPPHTLGIKGKAFHEITNSNELYFEEMPSYQKTCFYAIPYSIWQNRGATNMYVWMRYK